MTSPVANLPSFTVRWRTVGLLMGFAALGHFNRVGISVTGSEVFIPKLGIGETPMGWVYTAFLITYTIGMLPGGWLIDRIGSARALTGYGLAMGTFVALTGTLGWTASTATSLWIGLLAIRSLAGIGSAPLHPGAAHVVSDLLSHRGQATANGMVATGALVGIAFSYPVFGWLMDRLSWPVAFLVSGGALAGYGVLWHWLASPLLRGTHVASTAEESPVAATNALWRRGDLWRLAISYAAYGYFQYLFFYWLDYYFKSVLAMPAVAARWTTFWILLCQGAGMAIGGLSTDVVCRRLGNTWGRRGIVMTGMGLGAAFGLAGVNVTGQTNVAICLAISMAALGMCEGVFWTTATDIGGRSRGFSGAFMNTGGNLGGLISPVLTPLMAERIGWPGSIAVACGVATFGGVLWFAITPPDRHPPVA